MFIIKHKKIFLIISALLVIASILSLSIYKLKLGIDFKGGALLEASYENRPDIETVKSLTEKINIGEVLVQPAGENEYIIKTKDLTPDEHTALLEALNVKDSGMTEKNFNSIGPSVGKELRSKAILSIIVVVSAILLFMAYAFRKVSYPVSSWKYGIITILTLIHNIIIPAGVFALLGHLRGAEVDTLFVIALLTILGLSVHDTIVVFDRIRENLHAKGADNFAETVGRSTTQTFTRSVNTSLTIIFTLLALYFFGPETTKNFSLVLVVGMFFGIYSSLFVASPILVITEAWQQRKNSK